MNTTEIVLVILIAALATAISSNIIQLPVELTSSSIVLALLLILCLISFSYSPVVGIAAIALFAVVLFHRNIRKLVNYRSASVYGDTNIYKEAVTTQPYTTLSSEPREYSRFQETVPTGLLPSMNTEGFVGAPYGSEGDSVYGQFPLDQSRVTGAPLTDEFVYRPSDSTGSNEFEREGSSIDQKMDTFQY